MEHRQRFADERTEDMKEDEYVQTFFEFRKAFFLGKKAKKERGPNPSGSRAFLARYLGLGGNSDGGGVEARGKKLLDALAYMMYDYVGRVVETAIRTRTGGRLLSIASDAMLSKEEIEDAGAKIPPLPGRKQREDVRNSRAANPDGISRNRPLTRFPVGLEHRGNPLVWPRNTIENGRVLVEGGEAVDTRDRRLAEEAMAILEADFADFD